MQKWIRKGLGQGLALTAGALLLLAGCGGGPSSEERIETRVAEELTVAARLTTAVEAAATTPAPAATLVEASPTSAAATQESAPSPTPSHTLTPVPAASTPTTAPNTPTTAPNTPTTAPTPTPIVAAPLPVPGASNLVRSTDQDFGGLNVLLPGFRTDEVTDPMVFRGRIGMALSIYSVSSQSRLPGDGVQRVTFSIIDLETDETVYEIEEVTSLFCLFGGNTLEECMPFDFAAANNRWPNGNPIYNGFYRVDIFIETDDDEGQWNPTIEIQGALPRPTPSESDFSGQWQTNIGVLELQQTENEVSGTYHIYGDGQPYPLQGEVSGRVLSGVYEGYGGGVIRFELSQDGESFDGEWSPQGQSTANHWCGVRSGPLRPGCGYSGNWQSIGDYTPNYPPTMELEQTGDRVQGTFLNGLLDVAGAIDGRLGTEGAGSQLTLVGRWSIGQAAGDFRWRMVNLGSNQFVGRSVTADGAAHQWCGWRPGLSRPDPCFE